MSVICTGWLWELQKQPNQSVCRQGGKLVLALELHIRCCTYWCYLANTVEQIVLGSYVGCWYHYYGNLLNRNNGSLTGVAVKWKLLLIHPGWLVLRLMTICWFTTSVHIHSSSHPAILHSTMAVLCSWVANCRYGQALDTVKYSPTYNWYGVAYIAFLLTGDYFIEGNSCLVMLGQGSSDEQQHWSSFAMFCSSDVRRSDVTSFRHSIALTATYLYWVVSYYMCVQ